MTELWEGCLEVARNHRTCAGADKMTLYIESLEDELKQAREYHEESERQIRQWQDRTTKAEAAMERVRGLPRYEITDDTSYQRGIYLLKLAPNGTVITTDELDAALGDV